jgi:hypothetical protein
LPAVTWGISFFVVLEQFLSLLEFILYCLIQLPFIVTRRFFSYLVMMSFVCSFVTFLFFEPVGRPVHFISSLNFVFCS